LSRGRPCVYSSGRLSCSLRVRTQAPCPECRVSQRGLRRAGRRPRAGRAVLAAVGPQRQIRRQHKLSDRTTFAALEAGHRWPRVRDSGGDRLLRAGTDRRTNHRLPGLSGTEATSCPPICETRERPRQSVFRVPGTGSSRWRRRCHPQPQEAAETASRRAATLFGCFGEGRGELPAAAPGRPAQPDRGSSAVRPAQRAPPLSSSTAPPRSTLSPGSAMRSSPHGGTAWPERFPRWS
jgi:hypothetical protein